MNRRLIAGLICAHAGCAMTVSAQAKSIVPSFGTSAMYDDNVFHQPNAEGDMSVRFSPRLNAMRQTDRLALTGRLELDADRFATHHELTTAHAREAATFDARYSASRRLVLTAEAAFTGTETPADLNELTALTPGRARARRFMLHPSLTYDLGPRAEATVAYLVSADTLQGGTSVTTQTASASFERRRSALGGLRVEYVDQDFLFGTGQTTGSRAATAEWTRQADRGTTLTFRAGPRVTAGVLAPDVLASARRALRAGNINVSYQQTQSTLIGLAGIARIRSVTAGAERDLGPRLTLHATSGVVQTRQADLPSLAYRVSGGCDWRFAPRITLRAGYDTDLQHGNLYASQAAEIIRRNLVTLTLVVSDAATGLPGR